MKTMDYEDLVRKISPKLKGIVKRVQVDSAVFDGNDLYQEALLLLWVDFKGGKLNGKTDSYILQRCYFYLKNYIRKNYSRVHLISFDQLIEKNQNFDFTESLYSEGFERYVEDIDCEILIDQIKNNVLTKREKEVFCLSMEELTTREIGEKLGVSHVRVVKLKQKIKEKCKRYIKRLPK